MQSKFVYAISVMHAVFARRSRVRWRV